MSLVIFKAICNFTNDLGEVFSKKHRPLKLYVHLINKTTISHNKPIQKHVEAFKLFCVDNRNAIFEKKTENLVRTTISYSETVYIDIKYIFSIADSECTDIIWQHLLTISALVDPESNAKDILKEEKLNTKSESDFLADVISKVENNVDTNANPMEAITSIMQSGIFTDLVSGMGKGIENGSLDLGKLMGSAQQMISKLSDEAGDHQGGEQATNMINTMMSNMSNSEQGGVPDISALLGPMMANMMSPPPTNSIENKSTDKLSVD